MVPAAAGHHATHESTRPGVAHCRPGRHPGAPAARPAGFPAHTLHQMVPGSGHLKLTSAHPEPVQCQPRSCAAIARPEVVHPKAGAESPGVPAPVREAACVTAAASAGRRYLPEPGREASLSAQWQLQSLPIPQDPAGTAADPEARAAWPRPPCGRLFPIDVVGNAVVVQQTATFGPPLLQALWPEAVQRPCQRAPVRTRRPWSHEHLVVQAWRWRVLPCGVQALARLNGRHIVSLADGHLKPGCFLSAQRRKKK